MSKKGKGKGRASGINFEQSIGLDSGEKNYFRPEPSKIEGLNESLAIEQQNEVKRHIMPQASDPVSESPTIDAGRNRRQKKETNAFAAADNRISKPSTGVLTPVDELGLKQQVDKLSINKQQVTTTPSASGSSSLDSLKGSMQPGKAQVTTCKLARRPNFGTVGRPIGLISNYFSLTCKMGTIYHYDVAINSLDQIKKYGKPVRKQTAAEASAANVSKLEHQLDRNLGKLLCREVFDKLVKCKALKAFDPVYDGVSNIFTSKPLPFHSKETFVVEIEIGNKVRNYSVVIQPVKKENGSNAVDLKALSMMYEGQSELIMAFNCIMNHREPPSSHVQIEKSFFLLNQTNKMSLGEGIEIWYGYNQSIHLTQKGPSVVLNLTTKAFHKPGPVIDTISDILGRNITRGNPMNFNEIKKVEKALNGVRVNVTHLPYKRKYTVEGVSKLAAKDMKLQCDGKTDVSIAQYFQTKYQRLKYPSLHCLSMKTTNSPVNIPFEKCEIVEGQPVLSTFNKSLTAKIIRKTAIPPEAKFRAIHQFARDDQKESGVKMRNYNLFMEVEPRKLMGRVIDPPSLAYHNSNISSPDNRGVWRMDGMNLYRAGIGIESWILICFAERVQMGALQKFAEIFASTGKRVGLNFGKLIDIRKCGLNDTSEKVLTDAENTHASFAVVVLNRKDSYHNYDEIKFIADYKLGFVTQCIEDKVLEQCNEQIATNLCLKINIKFGGVNHILLKKPKFFARPVMILGADAVHSVKGSGCPSIAAVVGSLDAFPSRYKVACRVQENPGGNKISQELILEIREMVKSLLKAFYHHTRGKYPEKIIFFRDGVSEGQFESVRDKEVSEIQRASEEIIGCMVPITFIIVQKRHQTRLRPQNMRDGIGRAGNIPPGTTVDTDITHPDHFDYFLNSHEGIQGTSKPVHYTVLHDDNKFDADELQKLSYHLCYTYGKCNRSISIPAPVMYADLACYRAKKYADFHMLRNRNCGSTFSNLGATLPEHARHAINRRGRGRARGGYVEQPVGFNSGEKKHFGPHPSEFEGLNENLALEQQNGVNYHFMSSAPDPVFESPNISAGRGRRQKRETNAFATVDDRISGPCVPTPVDELGLKQVDKLLINKQVTTPGASGSSSSVLRKESPQPGKSQLTNCKLVRRPNFGTAGRPIGLISNYFSLACKTGTIYHYDVEINSLDQIKKYGKPVRKQTAAEASAANVSRLEHQLDRNVGKLKCREVFDKLVKCKALKAFDPVYDGVRNIFTTKPLPFHSKETFVVELEIGDKVRKYEVVIQPVKKESGSNVVDLKALLTMYEGQNELIMAFNSIMNHREPPSSQVQIGKSFFFLNQTNKIPLGEGIEIWFGYNQSIHLTQKGPSVVLNLAAKAFHKPGPVIDYICDILGRNITRGNAMNFHEIKRVEEALKGVRVIVTHLSYKRKYTVEGVSKLAAKDMKLDYDGKELSIAQYFQTKYKQLNYPYLHCLYMRTTSNQTFIPFETCEVIEGQPVLGKLSSSLTAKMIRQTAIPPEDRFKAINQSARDVQKESGVKMRSYNLLMELEPRKVMGRVIDPPSLAYHNSNTSRPDNRGVWRMEGKNFYRASIDIESWILLCFAERLQMGALQKFADIFAVTGKKVGLNFSKLVDIRKFGRHDTSEKVLKDAEKTRASFAVIVLNRKDYYHNYDEIKFIADYKLGFVTQCIEDKVLERFNDQIATNVCLKVNIKLGGVNHILVKKPSIFAKPVMILGADAVHSPRGSGCPSIAAVVGSLDAFPSRYKVACRVQENPDGNKISQELILEIREMVKSLLKAFYHHTKGKYPEKIIFFRDGVSEGQFETVRDKEVSEVQKASEEIIGYIVPITFIIVQKRHQTRLRPQNPRDGIGRGGNIPPGTTVDTDITHPDHFDYFLNSHEGIQGTSKPAHYTVLHDDNKFDADELQKLSYHLCYTYGKCNRSISIPAPVMYADLACYRAKKYADFHMQKDRNCGSSFNNLGTRLPEHARHAINSMGEYKASMFFV